MDFPEGKVVAEWHEFQNSEKVEPAYKNLLTRHSPERLSKSFPNFNPVFDRVRYSPKTPQGKIVLPRRDFGRGHIVQVSVQPLIVVKHFDVLEEFALCMIEVDGTGWESMFTAKRKNSKLASNCVWGMAILTRNLMARAMTVAACSPCRTTRPRPRDRFGRWASCRRRAGCGP